MIYAELVPQTENRLLVRFSNPDHTFGKNPFIQVNNELEAKRMLHSKNKAYIISTMVSWLKQRKHAVPSSSQKISNLIHSLDHIQGNSFPYICNFIGRFNHEFEAVAPSEKSRFYSHFNNVVKPILTFCK